MSPSSMVRFKPMLKSWRCHRNRNLEKRLAFKMGFRFLCFCSSFSFCCVPFEFIILSLEFLFTRHSTQSINPRTLIVHIWPTITGLDGDKRWDYRMVICCFRIIPGVCTEYSMNIFYFDRILRLFVVASSNH